MAEVFNMHLADESFFASRKSAAGCDVPEILESMSREQREHEGINFGATYMKYRKVVAEWMVDVCEYFTLHSTTTHAAIAYLDRLQPNEKFSRFEWQMLAICCILIASKYNECEDHVPDLTTLEEITQQSIPNETVLNYELWALKRMGWKLNARTPMAFLSSYAVMGTVLPSDVLTCDTRSIAEERVNAQCQTFATQCCLDVRFKGFKATDMAGAILFSSRRMIGVYPAWRTELTKMTTVDPLSGICSEIVDMIGGLGDQGLDRAADSYPTGSTTSPLPRSIGQRETSEETMDALVDAVSHGVSAVMKGVDKFKPSPTSIANMGQETESLNKGENKHSYGGNVKYGMMNAPIH